MLVLLRVFLLNLMNIASLVLWYAFSTNCNPKLTKFSKMYSTEPAYCMQLARTRQSKTDQENIRKKILFNFL